MVFLPPTASQDTETQYPSRQPHPQPRFSSLPQDRELHSLLALPRTSQKCSYLWAFKLEFSLPGSFLCPRNISVACIFAAFVPHSYVTSSEISSLNSLSKMHTLMLSSFTLLYVCLPSLYHHITLYYTVNCLNINCLSPPLQM